MSPVSGLELDRPGTSHAGQVGKLQGRAGRNSEIEDYYALGVLDRSIDKNNKKTTKMPKTI